MGKLVLSVFTALISSLAYAELDMDGKSLTDACERAALDIILEKSCINCTPNEPFYKFRSIRRVELEDVIYARGSAKSSQYELYEATLFEEYDGDAPTGREAKFYAAIELGVDCK